MNVTKIVKDISNMLNRTVTATEHCIFLNTDTINSTELMRLNEIFEENKVRINEIGVDGDYDLFIDLDDNFQVIK